MPVKNTTANLYCGVAKTEISTELIKVNDPLYAKVMVLKQEDTSAVIISMDAVGLDETFGIKDDFLAGLQREIESKHNIPADAVLVNTSHTHTAGKMTCDSDELLKRTLEAVKEAVSDMELVKIGSGTGAEERIAINRNLRLKNGGLWTIRHTYPSPPDDEVQNIEKIDTDIEVIRIDKANGSVKAVIINYACHPLLGVPDGSVTSNFPGYACLELEERYDGSMAFFLQGAGGDVVEVNNKTVSSPADSEPVGRMLGRSAFYALRGVKTTDGVLNIKSNRIRLPRRADFTERIDALYQEQKKLLASLRYTSLNFKTFLPLYLQHSLHPEYPSDYRYRYLHEDSIGSDRLSAMDRKNKANVNKYLSNIKAMERLSLIEDAIQTFHRHSKINERSGEDTIEAQIVAILLGECAIISAPIELLTDIGLHIKANSPFKNTIISAFSNGYMHYGAPAEMYDLGSYEVTECFLAPEWQEIYQNAAIELLYQL